MYKAWGRTHGGWAFQPIKMSECERQVTLFYGISRCSVERGAQNVCDVTMENDLISGLRSLEPPHPSPGHRRPAYGPTVFVCVF